MTKSEKNAKISQYQAKNWQLHANRKNLYRKS